MAVQWETPRKVLESHPKAVIELLRSSTILYTQSGDGYSALLYRPKSIEGSRLNDEYYWITQDSIVTPRLLRNKDGTNKDYSQAMVWLIANEAIQPYENGGNEPVCIEFGSDRSSIYQLESHLGGESSSCRLQLNWELFE